MHDNELCDLHATPNLIWIIKFIYFKRDETGMSFGMHKGKEICTEDDGVHTWNKQTSFKTLALMED